MARQVVDTFGGRISRALGIDLDAGDEEIERWFLAATLLGTRIAATIVEHTFHELDRAGLVQIDQVRHMPWEDLVDLLDIGGYVRYGFRTATRLQTLAERVHDRYNGQATAIAREANTYPQLRDALDALPGWGPVTVRIFLRELRGVWAGADPPLDKRATHAAGHLGLLEWISPPPTWLGWLKPPSWMYAMWKAALSDSTSYTRRGCPTTPAAHDVDPWPNGTSRGRSRLDRWLNPNHIRPAQPLH